MTIQEYVEEKKRQATKELEAYEQLWNDYLRQTLVDISDSEDNVDDVSEMQFAVLFSEALSVGMDYIYDEDQGKFVPNEWK